LQGFKVAKFQGFGKQCDPARNFATLKLEPLKPAIKHHRLPAWGVLGLATGGCFFSLLTLLFSGAVLKQTPQQRQSFGTG
jgi:hypothetical protein